MLKRIKMDIIIKNEETGYGSGLKNGLITTLKVKRSEHRHLKIIDCLRPALFAY